MTISETKAYEAMRAHHRVLGEQLADWADAVSGAAAGRPHSAAVAGFLNYLTEEVLPHAAAEEKTIYPAAVSCGLGDIVGEMIAEHVTLSEARARLADLTDVTAAAGQARQIAALFTAHAAKENDILLPALLDNQSADLAALLEKMQAAAGSSTDPKLDVRDLPPARRHTTIFDTYGALLPGTGFVLVNDHDPKPLRYQFEAEHPGEFTWDYLETGPDVWRVRIGRAG